MHKLALIVGVTGLMVSASPVRSQSTPWYNCQTREVWSPEKRAWCKQTEALRNQLRSAVNNPRKNYNAINLQQIKSSLTGSDPSAIALAAFGINEPQEGNFQQTMSVDDSNPQQLVVTITQNNLPDDSVRDVRYRVEFESVNQSQWQIVWAGRQNRCQQARGSQDWTTANCS